MSNPCLDCHRTGWLIVVSDRDGDPGYLDVERCDSCARWQDDDEARHWALATLLVLMEDDHYANETRVTGIAEHDDLPEED